MPARAPEYLPGTVLPGTKYQIVSELGAGGMGVVYHVVKPPEIQGVLKLMGADLAGHQEFRIRFLDEVRVLAKLDHPNIVRVSDYDFLADGTPFYVMEYLQGRTVRDVLATLGKVPPRVAFEITRQLCEALQCAHTNEPRVIHRDIKPENIFLHAPKHGDPMLKLIDFGVVAVSDRAHDGTFVGTWKYAAPEQIRGEQAGPATDLYAVGLVLYELLCGAGPFDRYETGPEVGEAHINEIPPPVSVAAPWVPKSIVQLIESALSKNPAHRPRDAFAFAERLFELEWANDGNDAHDKTSEGPLSRVLSTVSPFGDRPGQTAARPSGPVKHRGPTLAGVGRQSDLTSPGEDTLIAGLLGRNDPPPTPSRPKVIVRPSGAGSSSQLITMDGTDTFATHESGRVSLAGRKSWASVPLVIGFLATVGIAVIAIVAVVRVQKLNAQQQIPPPAVTTVAPPPTEPTPMAIPITPSATKPPGDTRAASPPKIVPGKVVPKASSAASGASTSPTPPPTTTTKHDPDMIPTFQ